jgi:hypothetical protein
VTESQLSQDRLYFADIPSGAEYLSRLPLANPPAAEQQLSLFLDSLLSHPPAPDTLLSLLEQVRLPLASVEEELARRYLNKALPLGEEERAQFARVISVWERMRRAYERCADMAEPMARNPQFSALAATVLQRCIYYEGMIIIEHYRARRELPAGCWVRLHGYYAKAEDWGVVNTPIEDRLESTAQITHCCAAYVTLLLIEIANPYSSSVRNLNLIRRWAGMWAHLVHVQPIIDDLEMPAYLIELDKDTPLHVIDNSEALGLDARSFDTSSLGLQVSQMLTQLRQRVTPSQLGLGDEISGYVVALLERLARPWTLTASPRRFRRFSAAGKARLAVGFEKMHFYVSGADFVEFDAGATYSRDSFDKLFTFRDSANLIASLGLRPDLEYPIDEWAVVNHSANGFRLARAAAGEKIALSQLLSVCPHDGDSFLLAQASWLMEESGGGLLLGVAILPGSPKGVAVRRLGSGDGKRSSYLRAFLLSPTQVIEERTSLVLPKSIYQASLLMELRSDKKTLNIRLKHIRQRGIDFDRVSFEIL